MPAAVETLRVVVGPAHQHWLLRGRCQGKRKGNYLLKWSNHQVLSKGVTHHSQLLPHWEERVCNGSLDCLSATGSTMGIFVLCFLLMSSMTPCFGLGCAKLTFSLGSSLLLMRDGVTEKVYRYQGKLSSRL